MKQNKLIYGTISKDQIYFYNLQGQLFTEVQAQSIDPLLGFSNAFLIGESIITKAFLFQGKLIWEKLHFERIQYGLNNYFSFSIEYSLWQKLIKQITLDFAHDSQIENLNDLPYSLRFSFYRHAGESIRPKTLTFQIQLQKLDSWPMESSLLKEVALIKREVVKTDFDFYQLKIGSYAKSNFLKNKLKIEDFIYHDDLYLQELSTSNLVGFIDKKIRINCYPNLSLKGVSQMKLIEFLTIHHIPFDILPINLSEIKNLEFAFAINAVKPWQLIKKIDKFSLNITHSFFSELHHRFWNWALNDYKHSSLQSFY